MKHRNVSFLSSAGLLFALLLAACGTSTGSGGGGPYRGEYRRKSDGDRRDDYRQRPINDGADQRARADALLSHQRYARLGLQQELRERLASGHQ